MYGVWTLQSTERDRLPRRAGPGQLQGPGRVEPPAQAVSQARRDTKHWRYSPSKAVSAGSHTQTSNAVKTHILMIKVPLTRHNNTEYKLGVLTVTFLGVLESEISKQLEGENVTEWQVSNADHKTDNLTEVQLCNSPDSC